MEMTTPLPSHTYTLDDLADFNYQGTPLAVLGYPVKHSISPQMHNAALRQMDSNGKYANWAYFKFEVEPEKLGEALPLLHQKGFRGVNLTIPHKVMAVDMIAEVDPSARRMGAVNTLKWNAHGYTGYNTDGYGMESAIREKLNIELAEKSIVLLGAGGAARAAAFQCIESGCRELWIGNRNQQRLSELTNLIQEHFPKVSLHAFDLSQPESLIQAPDLIINATSVGLKKEDPLPIDPALFKRIGGIYDMIYNPAVTPLLAEARERYIPSANGLSMLVWQGVRALEIWTGDPVPASVMAEAAAEALGVHY